MRVLITNKSFRVRGGAELYVRDVAQALLDRGHLPIVYSTDGGPVADEIRALTVPVIQDLDALAEPPDVIHGQDHVQTMTALLRFPDVPAVFFCHGWTAWEAAAPRFPRLRRYVAIDEVCRDRLVHEHAIPPDRIRVVLNSVDLRRFRPRGPLPARPRRALSLSNYLTEATGLADLRTACARAGIALDALGLGVGQVCERPDRILGEYDLVFARGRTALEAMAVGAAVVVCGVRGLAGLVTTANLDELRARNFGVRTTRAPMSVDALGRELARYDAADAARVSERIRATAGLDATADAIVAVYEDVIAEQRAAAPSDARAELRAAADYLRWMTPALVDVYAVDGRARTAEAERDRWRAEVARLELLPGAKLRRAYVAAKRA
jgi:Glycosyltransferase Family 4